MGLELLRQGGYDAALNYLYGESADSRLRFDTAAAEFSRRFGDREGLIFCSAPGRTELSGNHTDHNHGRVLAAAVQLDTIAVAAPRKDDTVRVVSKGYPALEVSLSELSVKPQETGTSAALIRGVAARLKELGYTVGGFDAYTASRVLKGSGLSSSAAFEVLVGTLLSELYNGGTIPPVTLALTAQYAENVYFGKPCGLMDQMACAVGGAVAIDFADPAAPLVRSIPVEFTEFDRALCIVDTKGDHADLTDEYAAIPEEMKRVAKNMGVGFLREACREDVLARASALRAACGDRAVLRALHFFAEDERAEKMALALENRDISTYESLMRESGRSSFQFLQNLYAAKVPECQGLPLAINVAEQILENEGAVRVHGGGFAGTVQALVPLSRLTAFREGMEQVFGEGCCQVLRIRPVGGVSLDRLQATLTE